MSPAALRLRLLARDATATGQRLLQRTGSYQRRQGWAWALHCHNAYWLMRLEYGRDFADMAKETRRFDRHRRRD